MKKNIVIVIVLAICAGLIGYIFGSPVQVQQVGGAVTGPVSDSPYQTVNGVDFYYFNQSMVATSSDVCTVLNPWPSSTSTLLSFTAIVTGNTMGAAYVDLSTTTQATSTQTASGASIINATWGSSTPALVKGYQLTSSAASALSQGSLVWTPMASTTSTTASSGVIAANPLPNGSSLVVLSPYTAITLRVASSSTVAGQLTGKCRGVMQKL